MTTTALTNFGTKRHGQILGCLSAFQKGSSGSDRTILQLATANGTQIRCGGDIHFGPAVTRGRAAYLFDDNLYDRLLHRKKLLEVVGTDHFCLPEVLSASIAMSTRSGVAGVSRRGH